MEQMTYEQVLASIDREAARRFVANAVIYLGGLTDWGSDEFAAVQEDLAVALEGSGLPPFGNQDDELLKFWGTLSLEQGNQSDYEPPLYVATVSVPGYLPMDDDPPTFMDAADAWAYLAEERQRGLEQVEEWDQDETLETLTGMAAGGAQLGSVVGPTPGYTGDHDLGLVYAVREVEEESL